MIEVTLAVACFGLTLESFRAGRDPFDFFRPTVDFTSVELQQLRAGKPVFKMLPDEDGEIGIAAAIRTTATGKRLIAWTERIEALKRSEYVKTIGRFSEPPQLTDLQTLDLQPDELRDVRSCRPGACDLKLTEDEMRFLHDAALTATAPSTIGDVFKRVLLERVQRYLADGHAAMSPYADRGERASPAAAFAAIAQHSTFLRVHVPDLARYLADYPSPAADPMESFVYWSHEQPAGQPSVNVTHVAIRSVDGTTGPEAIVAGKQIFATRYVSASLGITTIIRDDVTGSRYVVYVNRTRVDVLDHWYGGMARMIMTRRIRREANDVLTRLTTRLESGMPDER